MASAASSVGSSSGGGGGIFRGFQEILHFVVYGGYLLDALPAELKDPEVLEDRLLKASVHAILNEKGKRERRDRDQKKRMLNGNHKDEASEDGEKVGTAVLNKKTSSSASTPLLSSAKVDYVECKFTLRCSRAAVELYNAKYNALRRLLPTLREERSFKTTMVMQFGLRFLMIAVAAQHLLLTPGGKQQQSSNNYGCLTILLLLSLAQVIISPYSLLVSLHMLYALSTAMYLPHYLVHGVLFPGMHLFATTVLMGDGGGNNTHATASSGAEGGAERELREGFVLLIEALMAGGSGRGGPEAGGGETNPRHPVVLAASWTVNNAMRIPITPAFVAAFIGIDLLLCSIFLWYVPGVGPTKPKPWKKVIASIVFGFLNCKTFTILLLLAIAASASQSASPSSSSSGGRFFAISLPWFLLDMCLGLTAKVSTFLTKRMGLKHWALVFYHQHRIAHLPHVYQHAHKFHHFLTGTTAFDAHIYGGSGMPEELSLFWVEAIAAVRFGILPATLNPHILYLSWTNKIGHSEKLHDVDGCNAHAQHHLYHHRNFGIFHMALDLLMGTCCETQRYALPLGFTVEKVAKVEASAVDSGEKAPKDHDADKKRAHSISSFLRSSARLSGNVRLGNSNHHNHSDDTIDLLFQSKISLKGEEAILKMRKSSLLMARMKKRKSATEN